MAVNNRFLLDTDVCIHLMRYGLEKLATRLQSREGDLVAISVITLGELFTGKSKSEYQSRETQRIDDFLQLVPARNLPVEAASAYGIVRAKLESRGEAIGNNDLWIAAHALADGLTLVTNNEREFRRVRGLKLENWTK